MSTIKDKILMCPPDHFTVDYVINPWMAGHKDSLSLELARQQWQQLRDVLSDYADIVTIDPHPDLPDMVFTANAGVVLGRKAIASHFMPMERRPEEVIFKQWFRDNDFDLLDLDEKIGFEGAGDDAHTARTFPITADSLGENIQRPRYTDRVSRFLGGVAITIDAIDPPVSPQEIEKRIGRMRSQPDFAAFVGRDVGVFGLEPADPLDPGAGYRSVAVCVYDSDLSYFDVDFDTWDRELAANEWRLAVQALQRRTSLEEVRSFSSAVAATLAANAIVAVTLSLLGIMIYIWVRFGSLRYSLAAIVALVHDVTIALGLLALTAWVADTQLASFLLIEEFRIDLGVVAGMLTIIGYSLNDTIVILDRIRENRGKLPIPTADIVDRSINQTISRTVLTSTTTLLAVAIMYGAGGGGIRPFAFCLLAGVLVGTYSSVAIAAPLVVRAAAAKEAGSESPAPGGRP